MLTIQKDPYRAWDRTGPGAAVSWDQHHYIQGHCYRMIIHSVAVVAVVAVAVVAAALVGRSAVLVTVGFRIVGMRVRLTEVR